MKKNIKYLLLGIVAVLAACGSDPATETEEKIFMGKLAGTWQVSVAAVDGEDISGAFDGLEIAFSTGKSITVTNPVDPIWPASGTFELIKVGNTFSIDRSDGVVISVVELTATSLVMQFHYNAGARLSSVSGEYTFEMNQ